MTVQQNDILWKGIIEDFFEPLLRFFFKEANQLFNFTKGFVFLDKELAALSAGPALQHPKVVDKLVRVYTGKTFVSSSSNVSDRRRGIKYYIRASTAGTGGVDIHPICKSGFSLCLQLN